MSTLRIFVLSSSYKEGVEIGQKLHKLEEPVSNFEQVVLKLLEDK